MIAAHARPDDDALDIATYTCALDDLAAKVDEPSAEAVMRSVFGDAGFRGNTDEYYDPSNSYLDRVIERRVGIPITLAVVAMEVARRVGVGFEGVGMPGHFLLKDGNDEVRDPFERGRVISVEECTVRFHAVHGAAVPFHPSFLEVASPHAIVARVLANLRQIHATLGDQLSLRWVLALQELTRLRNRLN